MTAAAAILIARPLPDACEARLDRAFNARRLPAPGPHPTPALIEAAAGCAALVVTVTERLDAAAIAALPDTVRLIATVSVGHDHIDVAAARRRGIAVTNTPDVLTDATADLTLLLLLGAARRAKEAMALIAENRWGAWSATGLLGVDIGKRRMGILGMGRIGAAVARRARAFGMDLHYHNRRRAAPEVEAETGARWHPTLDGLLAVSDVLVLNAASTPETRGIVNAATLARLPEGAILVNSARGDLVDDEAVIAALDSGRLFAAGLDVFRGEPALDPRYRDRADVFALPHIGSATMETRVAMGMLALDNVAAVLAGQPPLTPLA
ncbi:NAD(P)-dependent oxidoreductase [Zavarzinia compransoris]|uniref:D-glycerate dehydrogenase n=1 Tax=Zavarzinia compransoris TaxID=1264899 RepID=A0A317EB45_9PROT|nr:NAD(P)-dependent oxidoreductase [Zavarzinia compransoris]PWR23426.1 D-glycerate dehydrogenase [Zavarzinia compransoris]TDP45998.1 glyoxylate reductase [Zavarzinia compransoris]